MMQNSTYFFKVKIKNLLIFEKLLIDLNVFNVIKKKSQIV